MRCHSQLWLLLGLLLCMPWTTLASESRSQNSDRAPPEFISTAELPPEARETLRLIQQGGPFPYARDGVIFGNFEQRLPKRTRGYYREYTVKTPGVRNRGARRIVCGTPIECFYSDDHYRTFRRIRE